MSGLCALELGVNWDSLNNYFDCCASSKGLTLHLKNEKQHFPCSFCFGLIIWKYYKSHLCLICDICQGFFTRNIMHGLCQMLFEIVYSFIANKPTKFTFHVVCNLAEGPLTLAELVLLKMEFWVASLLGKLCKHLVFAVVFQVILLSFSLEPTDRDKIDWDAYDGDAKEYLLKTNSLQQMHVLEPLQYHQADTTLDL